MSEAHPSSLLGDDLVFRLRKRAEIRRQIPGRRSTELGERDRLADLLDEAADEIEQLKSELDLVERSYYDRG